MKKVCKQCKIFIDGNECPICHESVFVESWKGRIIVTNYEQSELAKKLGIKRNGEYALKTR